MKYIFILSIIIVLLDAQLKALASDVSQNPVHTREEDTTHHRDNGGEKILSHNEEDTLDGAVHDVHVRDDGDTVTADDIKDTNENSPNAVVEHHEKLVVEEDPLLEEDSDLKSKEDGNEEIVYQSTKSAAETIIQQMVSDSTIATSGVASTVTSLGGASSSTSNNQNNNAEPFQHNQQQPITASTTGGSGGNWFSKQQQDLSNSNSNETQKHLHNSKPKHSHHIPFVANNNNGDMFNKGNNNKTNTANIRILHRKDNLIGNDQIELQRYVPPDSFTFTAKITSSSEFAPMNNNKKHNVESSQKTKIPSIPFIECNNVGTTTPLIPNNIAFRHFAKSGAHPTTYTKTHGMIIALSQIEIQTKSSSEKRVFKKGDVIWVDGGEYMMTAANGSDDDLSVLIVNIDSKVIKKSRKGDTLFAKNNNGRKVSSSDNCLVEKEMDDNFENMIIESISNISIRRVILSSVGLTLSSIFAYFLSKVAPLQLAVGVGGVCIIAGGTYASVLGGEWLCDEVEKSLFKNPGDDDDSIETIINE